MMIILTTDEKQFMKIANGHVGEKKSFCLEIKNWKKNVLRKAMPLFLATRDGKSPNWWIKFIMLGFYTLLTPVIWVPITYAEIAGYKVNYEDDADKFLIKLNYSNE